MTKLLVSLAVASVLFLGAEVRAQESASSGIVARVVDATQGALPGATVIATNVGTRAERTATTDVEGRFSILGLPAATYRLRVELDGFAPTVLDELVLRLGQIASPVVSLRVAGLAESVTVQGEAPLLQTANASVGQVIADKQLKELPTVDRSVLQLVTLAAGVSGVARGRFARNFGTNYVTVDGGRDSSTNYTIDGVIVRSQRFNKMAVLPPLDAVQEVNLLRNSFSTEYGQGQAALALVTKSGTNAFSGTFSDYFRHEKLNARNYFAPAGVKPPFRRNILDTTFGGPIVRNRIFVFGSYEGGRRSEPQTLLNIVPDPRFLTGDLSSLSTLIIDPLTGRPFPGNIVPKERFSNYSKVIAPLIPAPNAPGVNNHVRTGDTRLDTDTVTVRVDQTLSSNHTLFQRFIWSSPRRRSEAAVNIQAPLEGARNLAAGHTWVLSPTIVNEVRVGYNFYEQAGLSLPYNASDATRNVLGEIGIRNILGVNSPKYYAPPITTITGYTALPGWGPGQGVREEAYSFSNATSKTLNSHNLRFGIQGQFRKFFLDTPFSQQGRFAFTGVFSGNALADFLLGYCGVCAGMFGSGDGDYRSPTVAPFFDDIWRVNNRLTLRTGVRWEYLAPWTEVKDRQGTFDPEVGKLGYHKVPANIPPALEPLIIRQDGHFPRGILQKDLNNWAPRVGATFEVNARTVIRTGFGIYYDNVDLNELQFTRSIPPFAGLYEIVPDRNKPVDAATLFPDFSLVDRFPGPLPIDPKSRTSYTRQWNASVQRSIGRDYVMELAYTGSRGRNLNKRFPLNQPREGTAPLAERLPYPQWDMMIATANDAYSDFEGLSVRGEKRFAAGWSFVSSYQISRNRDNNSGTQEFIATAFERDKDADYGYSAFHAKHRGTVSFIYELPFGKERHWLTEGPAAHLLGGWQVSGLIRMQSGSPFEVSGPNVCRCGAQAPNRVNFAPGREKDKGKLKNPTPERWFDVTAFVVPELGFQGRAGRNFLFGPPYRTVDVAISRTLRIDTLRLDFRGEVYNLLNTTNFDNPVADISNRNVARIISAGDPRIVQMSLRVAW